ncbi:hypothetical protein O6H91_15G078700 [Diphasiastrum complanatum]|uniref:Uncharacterized protein n=2 Tax=Diphasiastrum complanatum TaxID=34168 RepID=A0ACC2BK50_DIPCM|nr:hypothetical protein O6H91_15G078700 [Diphasiastrum complanatum]KAJ7530094.1 hypothetical protein O6H91_15G078700 [Diphasiastrum complanatum]
MPRYYCDYCDTYLTHDSPSVRKQHNAGYKHKANVRAYYQQFEEQQTQSLIDQKVKEHLGQQAAFQHFAALQSGHYKPPLIPVLPRPSLPLPGSSPASTAPQLTPLIRPPVLPPPGAPVTGYNPSQIPPMFRPPVAPGSTTSATQPTSMARPPTLPLPGPPGIRPAGSSLSSTANGTPNPLHGSLNSYQQPGPVSTSGSYGTYNPTSQPIGLAGTLSQPQLSGPTSSNSSFTSQQAPQMANLSGAQGSFTYGQTPPGQSSVGQATNTSFTSPPGAPVGYQS